MAELPFRVTAHEKLQRQVGAWYDANLRTGMRVPLEVFNGFVAEYNRLNRPPLDKPQSSCLKGVEAMLTALSDRHAILVPEPREGELA